MKVGELVELLATYDPSLPVHVRGGRHCNHIDGITRQRKQRKNYGPYEFLACVVIEATRVTWFDPEPDVTVRGPMTKATRAVIEGAS